MIVNFLKSNIFNWKTTQFLSHKSGNLKSNPVDIKRGIFQGDSVSPLLFCLPGFPLTTELRKVSARKALIICFTRVI